MYSPLGSRTVNTEPLPGSRALAGTQGFEQCRRDRKRVEMLFAHLKRIFRLNRLRLWAARRTG